MLVPIYGFVRGDTLGVLVLVQETDTVETLAAVLEQATSVRVAPGSRAEVRRNGVVLDPRMTLRQVGLAALDRVDLVAERRS